MNIGTCCSDLLGDAVLAVLLVQQQRRRTRRHCVSQRLLSRAPLALEQLAERLLVLGPEVRSHNAVGLALAQRLAHVDERMQ
jgi:hypothetical protein